MVGFFIAFAVINAITFFPIGVFTFLNNSKSRSNQTHSLFCMAVFFWSISYIFWLRAGSYEAALFWARALDAFSIFIPIFFYHWVFVLLGKDNKNPQKIFLILTYLASIFSPFSASAPFLSAMSSRSFSSSIGRCPAFSTRFI